MRWILAKALDHACVPSQLSPFIISPLSHPSLPSSRQLFSAFDSVSAFCFRHSSISAFSISLPCFQFTALASIILPRSRSGRLRFLSFVSSSSTSSRSRHLYNMSPIMTFLVSGLLPFVSASPFILGFLAMSPVPFMASCFSVRRRTSWLLPPSLGLKTPAKLHFLSWVYKLVVAPPSRFEDPCKTSLSIPPHFRLGQSLCISPPIGFVDLSSSLFRLVRRYSHYPFFVVSSSRVLRFLVVFLCTYPIPSVCFKFSAISDIPCLASVSSFVFYYPYFVTLGIGLCLQSPRPVDTSPVLHRFLLILILPFPFYSFVLWDTHSSAPA